MIAFMIKRPIAVSMVFLAMLIMGVVATAKLPVNLIPGNDIPRISINIHAPNYYARDLENSIMAPLRNYLMQANGIADMKTDARNGFGTVSLLFDRGTNIDLAFMEVNEQIDKAMVALPADITRPAVMKATASDIPVMYLDILLKEEYVIRERKTAGITEEILFLELSNFANEVLRRRLEQLPEVAMADMSGRAFPEIIIKPDMNKLKAMNMPLRKIEALVRAFHNNPESIKLEEKQHHYHVRVTNNLLTADDIGELYIKHGGRLWQLSDLCSIEMQIQPPEGKILSGNRRAISIAIIKQADASMHAFQKALTSALKDFEKDHPSLEFTINRDQTEILDHALLSLKHTIMVAAVLAFAVMLLFISDTRAPWLIIVSVPAAAVISMLFFFLTNLSINVISVSGLILCAGMMIDNSIIVIDNISRHREQGKQLYVACTDGTNEVIKPLLCSVLTSCSVFIPLVFSSSLASALFFEQAIAVSIGLMVSFMIAIFVVPVYYHLLYKQSEPVAKQQNNSPGRLDYKKMYTAGFFLCMRNQQTIWLLASSFVAALFVFFALIRKESMPDMQRNEMLLLIDWNENIHVSENARRVRQMLNILEKKTAFSNSMVGGQQFLLTGKHYNDQRQSTVYLQATSHAVLDAMQDELRNYFRKLYPETIYYFETSTGLFDYVFGSSEPPLEVRLLPSQTQSLYDVTKLQKAMHQLQKDDPTGLIRPVSLQESLQIEADPLFLAMYDVDYIVLTETMRKLTGKQQLITLADGHTLKPVKTARNDRNLLEIIEEKHVISNRGKEIPLRQLLRVKSGMELKNIVAGMEGEYYPVELNISQKQLKDLMHAVKGTLEKNREYRAGFHGSLFSRQILVRQLGFTASIAIILLFLILAAQFESLKLPFIVLLEVPIATSGALALLYLFGVSLNVMSMIGLVVMAGIIINDSILKIDTINRLHGSGMSLLKALITAGHYRLNAILMTSMTTICALLPFLFIGGMGSELQKPLAIAVIGGLGLGTMVSLFFIPVAYHYLNNNRGG